jgi:putative phage-type endonuclease
MSDDRRSYVGGPGAAAILGVSPWQTPVALWLQLTGRAPLLEVNDAMRSGQRLERAVLDYAGDELGAPILPGPFVRDPTLPLGGHLDGQVQYDGRLAVVEAKTVRSKAAWGEPGTADVPAHVAAQCLHYMGLTEARVAWIPVLFSGLEFAMYRVDRDDTLVETMRELCARWWRDYVVTDTPPPPTTGTDASLLFPRDTGRVVIASDPVAADVATLRDVRYSLGSLEAQRDELESRIKLAMGDGATLTINGEIACTWKGTKPSLRFDSGAFKAAQPETYSQFCRPVESRRFLLKDQK